MTLPGCPLSRLRFANFLIICPVPGARTFPGQDSIEIVCTVTVWTLDPDPGWNLDFAFFLTVLPWVSHFTSPSLRLLKYEMRWSYRLARFDLETKCLDRD